jgi:hypothetical protein
MHAYGYQLVCVDGHKYPAHRLAWLIAHGVWPDGQIDHINGNRADNRLENLRDVPRAINAQNQRRAPKNSASGFLGVSRHNNRWRARITIDKRTVRLGTFDTPHQAYAAYLSAKRQLHDGCTI